MINVFKPRLLISTDDADYLNFYFLKIIDLFGADIISNKNTVLPDNSFFDWTHNDNEDSTLKILEKVKSIMDINAPIKLTYYKQGSTREEMDALGEYSESSSGAAGMFSAQNEQYTVRLNRTLFDEPIMLVATIVHELAHYKLLVEKQLKENDEYLTEVLTAAYGFGIFSGNAALIFRSWSPDYNHSAWSVQRQGYLSRFMWGYVMALNQLFKNENTKLFSAHLNGNVKDSMKKTMRYFQFNEISYKKICSMTPLD